MNIRNITTFVLALLVVGSVFAGFVHAAPLPITIDRVEIDDVEMDLNGLNRLDIEREGTYDVEVRFTALADIDNVEIEVFVSGYEYNDIERIVDTTSVFDADAGVTYNKRFEITFPQDVQEDDYRLRVMVTDRNNDALIQTYNLKLDVPRHELRVEDVYFSPSGSVLAGHGLLSTVRVENGGERDQDDVRVKIALPTLGISAFDYIDEIENGEEQETEEMFLRVPVCTAAGVYPVEITVEYDEMNEKLTTQRSIIVDANSACNVDSEDDLNAELMALLQAMQAEQSQVTEEPTAPADGKFRSALWVTLLILLVLCVLAGLILAFNKMGEQEF